MNLLEIKNRSIKLVNNYSTSGNLITSSDPNQQDYLLRMNSLIDDAQFDIATTAKKIRASYKISQNAIVNGLSSPLYLFDVQQYLGTDKTYVLQGAKAYSFKVDNIATIYVEEEIAGVWTLLTTLTQATAPQGYVLFKGRVTPSNATNNVRLRFSGAYPYNFREPALYAYSFPTDNAVPEFVRYNSYSLPSDFYELHDVVFKGNQTDGYPYVKTADYYFENGPTQSIAINYYNKGEYTIYYNKYPTTIDDTTLDSANLEVDLEAQKIIPYYVGSQVIMDENQSIGTLLLNMYEAKKAKLMNNDVVGQNVVESTTGW